MENIYWQRRGERQDLVDAVRASIPSMGRCWNDMRAEVVRMTMNWYHDVYNNGGGNWKHRAFLFNPYEDDAPRLQSLIKRNQDLRDIEYESGEYECDGVGFRDGLPLHEDSEYLALLEAAMTEVLVLWETKAGS